MVACACMQTLSQIRAILAERGLRPKKRLGQHFLHDKNQLAKLVEAAQIQPGEVVLEVGPGTGTLTEALLERSAEIIVCEIDHNLASIIADRFGGQVRLVVGDCLQHHRSLSPDLSEALHGQPFKLVSNLPFQVASSLMCVLLIDNPLCRAQFITIQKEVADRLMAKPRTKEYGPLTIIVGALSTVQHLATLTPTCFWPAPKVSSAMFAIRPRPDHGLDDPGGFARFTTELFTKRRKQLGRILGHNMSSLPTGVTADLRPEALTIEQIVALWRCCRPNHTGPAG